MYPNSSFRFLLFESTVSVRALRSSRCRCLLEALPIGSPCVDSNAVFSRIADPKPFQQDEDATEAEKNIKARALLYYQHHFWGHSKSCFKRTKRTPNGTTCRPCETTQWTKDDRVVLKRCVGNEYVNAYVPLINYIFKTNHDVKFLATGEGTEKAFYTMKYTAKPQIDLENPMGLHLTAFDEEHARFADTPNDLINAGRSCIQSMCCTLPNLHVVAAPLTGLYILQESPFYHSHPFVKVYPKAVLNVVFGDEDVQGLLQPDESGATFKARSIFFDYVERPLELDESSLMEFMAGWEIKRDTTGSRLTNRHSQYSTHSVHYRKQRAVVTIIGARLPDTRDSSISGDLVLMFRRTISVLFWPFRYGEVLGHQASTFDAGFTSWWQSSNAEVAQMYVKNNNDYYESRELARDKQSDPDVARYSSYVSSIDEDEFESMSDRGVFDFGHQADTVHDGELDAYDDFIDGDDLIRRISSFQRIKALTKCDGTLKLAATSSHVPMDSNTAIREITMHDLDTLVTHAEKAYSRSGGVPVSGNMGSTFPSLATRVELIQSAIQNTDWHERSDERAVPLNRCPSLQDRRITAF